MSPTVSFILISLLKIVGIVFLVILPMVSYAVYAERKVSALIQDRLGPNRVGPAGLFQPIADAMKFLLKEDFTPAHVNKLYYWLAPCLAMVPAITTIAVVPFGSTLFGVPSTLACFSFLRSPRSVFTESSSPAGPRIQNIPSSAGCAQAPK